MLSSEHAANRKDTLGSTDVTRLFGFWGSPGDVWLEKTGRAEAKDLAGIPAVEAGIAFEGPILDWAERQPEIGDKIKRNELIRLVDGNLRLSGQLDGVRLHDGTPVEAKTAGLMGPLSRAWGDAMTDEVPPQYLIQSHVQMILAKADEAFIAAFLGGVGFRLYTMERNANLSELIQERASTFWTDYILADTPPPQAPTLDMARLMVREPRKTIFLPPGAAMKADELRGIKEQIKTLDAAKHAAEAEVLMAMGDAEVGILPDGQALTYFAQTRHGIDTKALVADVPDAKEKWPQASTFRVLRTVKKWKGESK